MNVVWCARALFILVALSFALSGAQAAERVRVGVLKFGTVNWELQTILRRGLDAKEDVQLDVLELASEDATGIALQAGSVDVIVTDWLFVSRQRSAGSDLTFYPFSTSVGAIMVPEASPIRALDDLEGSKLGVAGGPLDKTWLLIQGLARRDLSFDLALRNELSFGAPPLLAEKALQGELDAVLNYWQFCAKLEAKGFRRLVSGAEAARALGAEGPVSAIGYVFHEAWASKNDAAIRGFLRASREAKRILASSDEEWARLNDVIRAEDDATLRVLMARFREGIPSRPIAEEERDAARLYAVLAELGGEKLVGPARSMAPGTYWAGAKNGL